MKPASMIIAAPGLRNEQKSMAAPTIKPASIAAVSQNGGASHLSVSIPITNAVVRNKNGCRRGDRSE